MKSVIIIAIAFVLLIPITVFAQEEFDGSTGDGLDDLRNEVEALEHDFYEWQSLRFFAFLGLVVEVVGIGLILTYWNKNPPLGEYNEWIDLHEHLYVNIDGILSEPLEIRNGIPTAYIIIDNVTERVTGTFRVTRYEEVPKEFNDLQRWKRKIPISFLVFSGFLFQGIQFL